MRKQSYWNQIEDVKKLYEDGLTMRDKKTDTYYDFVKDVYTEAGGNRFFEKFVAKNYKREIKIWRYTVETQKILKTDQQIAMALKNVNFKEFDMDKIME